MAGFNSCGQSAQQALGQQPVWSRRSRHRGGLLQMAKYNRPIPNSGSLSRCSLNQPLSRILVKVGPACSGRTASQDPFDKPHFSRLALFAAVICTRDLRRADPHPAPPEKSRRPSSQPYNCRFAASASSIGTGRVWGTRQDPPGSNAVELELGARPPSFYRLLRLDPAPTGPYASITSLVHQG